MRSSVIGLGQWLPEDVRTNDFWPPEVVDRWRARIEPEKADGHDGLLAAAPDGNGDRVSARYFAEEASDPFVRSTKRHIAAPGTTSYWASAQAACAALADAEVDPIDVDVVLAWEVVPDRPGMTGAGKIAELCGAHRARGITADSGCASPVTQLELACALVESGRARYVVCTQSHFLPATYPIAHPVSPILGDAATAFVVGPTEHSGVLGIYAISDGRYYHAVTWTRGKDDATDTPWWVEGGPFTLASRDRARAQQIIRETVRSGALTVREACSRARVSPRSIDVLSSVHPRRWIPAGIAETLGLPEESAPHTFDETAHTGGCCVVTNLLEARKRGLLRAGATVAIYAQGLGFTRAAAVLRWGAR
jgi:3-oxoacyl-[acyl-carrier-protein] synthase-3